MAHQPSMPATWHIIQTKLATEAKASDSRARRTICRISVVRRLLMAGVFSVRSYSCFVRKGQAGRL